MKSRLARFLPFLVPVLLAALLIAASGDRLIAKKVVAHLAMPAGLLWLISAMAVCWPGLGWRKRAAAFAVWALYSLAGSPYVGVALLGVLERPLYAYEQPTERLDALVLLGGGTGQSPGGRPALGTHGDRITRPAILFNEGLVGMLVTTGRSITETGEDRLLSHETAELWGGLGIPGEAIVEVPEPRNTREEMAAIAELVKQHPEWRRIGLCSSASHLPRALREARLQGLDLVPVPSDFRSDRLIASPLFLVPQGRGFRDVQTALWELLGRVM